MAVSYTDVSTGIHRQGEYDSVMRHWQNRSDKFREQKDNMLKDYQKAQGWLYRWLCASFAQKNLTKIQMYEPNSFRNFLIKENLGRTLLDDLENLFRSYWVNRLGVSDGLFQILGHNQDLPRLQ